MGFMSEILYHDAGQDDQLGLDIVEDRVVREIEPVRYLGRYPDYPFTSVPRTW